MPFLRTPQGRPIRAPTESVRPIATTRQGKSVPLSRCWRVGVAGNWRSGHTGGIPIMPHATISRGALRRTRTRSRRARRSAAWRLAGRALLALRVAPSAIRIVVGTVLLVAVWAAVNWMVQVARKPTEVFFPVSGSLVKTSGADLAAIRPALRQALHSGHHAGTAGRTGPGGGQRQPDGTDLLEVATQLEPIRGVPAGLERSRHVSDHRRHLRRSQTLLHP